MGTHILTKERTKIASKGDFVEVMNIGKADVMLSTGFPLRASKGDAPVGGRYNAMGVADDLFAWREVDGADRCEIVVTARPAPPELPRYY